MLSVTRIKTFEAAHQLPSYQGACRQVHGHSYKLEVTVSQIHTPQHNKQMPMIIDFKKLDTIIQKQVIDRLDHCMLNDHFDNEPTAEEMVRQIVDWLAKPIKLATGDFAILTKVRLWETADSYATWESEK